MPVTYAIDTANRLIHTTCAGPITVDDVINHFRELERDPTCPPCVDVLLEVLDTTSAPKSGELSDVAAEIARVRKKIEFGVCAIAAHTDVLFGMMRMFEVLTEEYFHKTQVFRTVGDARVWLASQRRDQPVPGPST